MATMQVTLVALFLLANTINIDAGTNWDAQWKKVCPDGQSIGDVSSVHSNHHEDRSWTFLCRSNFIITRSCYWSGWLNGFDQELLFQCPKGVITGVYSYHSNHHEDRRFQMRCCQTLNNYARDCTWTGYVNNWDGYLSYSVPNGYFLTGAKSHHDNHREDRRWKFLACKHT